MYAEPAELAWGKVAVGVAGWSYPDWDGWVYPKSEKDKLGFVSRYVDMIEINSTFYRPPEARLSERWLTTVEQRPAFFFTAKLHQDFTHHQRLSVERTEAFRLGLAPLREAGRLRFVLAQFRYDFTADRSGRAVLEWLARQVGAWVPLVVEVRHRSWQEEGALECLQKLGVEVAHLDYPLAADSFDLAVCPVGRDGYLRLHGRNRAAWFDKKAGRDETYDYAYNAQELAGLKERIAKIAKARKSMTVVANNHYHGKEVATALQLKALLTGERQEVPPLLLARFPELGPVAKAGSPDLFSSV